MTPDSTIIDALDNPELFAPHFRGDTWRPWRAFLKALFALPLSDSEAETYRACTGRTAPPAAPFTEAALIVGRRGGKSRKLALIATFLATMRDYEPFLAPGEVATVAVLASTQKQARTIFRYVSGLLKAVPALTVLVADETNEIIELSNRVVIEISTASFRATRGYSYAAVLCDEIAFWRSEENSANPDVEILRALRPGMASIPGSILLLASSPYAKKGALYSAYRRHFGKDDARVLVWKADTATMNPRIDPAIIREAYEDDPESAKAEYGAEFRDDLADFITREVVDAITCWGRRELPHEPGITYSAFCDPSFEQSARPKNDLYHDLLPLANARRVELLEHQRLSAQLVGLERRVARSGRDSIDHTPGGHDDVANAVAGVLVGLDLDRRPALIRRDDMLTDGAAVPVPHVCNHLVAVLTAAPDGQCATTFWAYSRGFGVPLVLLDFEISPLTAGLFTGIRARLIELGGDCRPRIDTRLYVTSEPLLRLALAQNLYAEMVPQPLIADPARLALAAAGHVLAGSVKIAVPAYTRAASSPLRGQLDLRGGDPADTSPLRLSLLAGIAICLDPRDQSELAA
jgi:hypothetical protein